VEGLDFLDGKLERLEEAHERGIRHVQLVHYTPKDIGDFQTGAITHQGLTEFGTEVIRACDRLGFVCDVAHATEDMAKRSGPGGVWFASWPTALVMRRHTTAPL
jgi:membrane dipeptidase